MNMIGTFDFFIAAALSIYKATLGKVWMQHCATFAGKKRARRYVRAAATATTRDLKKPRKISHDNDDCVLLDIITVQR